MWIFNSTYKWSILCLYWNTNVDKFIQIPRQLRRPSRKVASWVDYIIRGHFTSDSAERWLTFSSVLFTSFSFMHRQWVICAYSETRACSGATRFKGEFTVDQNTPSPSSTQPDLSISIYSLFIGIIGLLHEVISQCELCFNCARVGISLFTTSPNNEDSNRHMRSIRDVIVFHTTRKSRDIGDVTKMGVSV
jgi:hypothetical protein